MGDKTGIEWTEATWCTGHKARHPRDDFGPDRSRSSGLAASCRAYRREMADRKRTTQGPGVAERRERKTVGQSWCRGCLDWLPSTSVSSDGVCRPHANAEYRANYAANPEPIRARAYARKRRLEPIPLWWSESLWDDFRGQCAYGCGRVATDHEHVWPVDRGGISQPGNIVPACSECNNAKRAKDPMPWVLRGFVAFPDAWYEVVHMAIELGCDEWMESA